MGLMSPGDTCKPFDCLKRDVYVQAERDSMDMIKIALDRLGYSACDQLRKQFSHAPYFSIANNLVAEKRKYYSATASISGIPAPVAGEFGRCNNIANLMVDLSSLNITACETIIEVTVDWGDCKCKRLPVEWCGDISTVGNILTLSAKAYNFVDLDAHPMCVNEDVATYLGSVKVNIVTTQPSKPDVHWYAKQTCACNVMTTTQPCSDNCIHACVGEACIEQTGETSLIVSGWECSKPCTSNCAEYPVMFTLETWQSGMWSDSWSRAVLGLMNSKLPYEFCDACHPMSTLLYEQDTKLPERAYPTMYRNGFGLMTPGAYFAYATIMQSISHSTVIQI
jgi:hypothetical protein